MKSLFLAQQLKDERKKVKDAEAHESALQRRNDELAAEIADIKKIGVFREWLFFIYDPAPRMPICPLCHSNGCDMRLSLQYANVLALPQYIAALKCFKCGFQINIDLRLKEDSFVEKLGWDSLVWECDDDDSVDHEVASHQQATESESGGSPSQDAM